ncbi:MAG: beta/gamma crystallin-related protein [Vicinamibacterales bacterium]
MALLSLALQAGANVTLYEHDNFQGRSFTATSRVDDIEREGFNDRASSAVVRGEHWQVCEDARFGGRCVVLRAGQYPSFSAMGLNDRISSLRSVGADARLDDRGRAPAPQEAKASFYEREDFQGRSFATTKRIGDFTRFGFNDRASSASIAGDREDRWEVCEDARFRGRCLVLRPGNYPSLAAMGLNDRISSARQIARDARVEERRYAPAPLPAYGYRRRSDERLHEARVTSARAVLGTPEQRCWVERERISQERGAANVPAAIAGAIIGGILGHQVGGGRGQSVATAGGAIAGAAVGANIGRDRGEQGHAQDVRRCEDVPGGATPDYWDVTYEFRGVEHRVQMVNRPGNTITVNGQGEPRE